MRLPGGSYAIVPVFIVLLISVRRSSSESLNPGARIRLSENGLKYAESVVVEILQGAVRKITIPGMKKTAQFAGGKVEYEVKNIKIKDFLKPRTSVKVDAGKGVSWHLSGLGVKLGGDWNYKYTKGVDKISDHGTFEGQVSGAFADVSAALRQDSRSGGLTISSTGCTARIASLRIRVRGGASWLNDFFHAYIERPIGQGLEKALCVEARRAIDESVARALATLPLAVNIGRDWLLDYRLVSAPAHTPAFLQSFHKAEVFHVSDKTEAPFQADVMPDSAPHERMVSIWLSDYILNTAGYAMYRRGVLRHTLTAAELPAEYRGYLDTTCHSTSACFGTFVPQVQKRFPNATVELEATASEAPRALISERGVEGRAVATVVHRARLADGSLAYLFTANVSVLIAVTPKLNGTTVKAKVTQLTPEIKVTNSSVGDISSSALTSLFNLASKLYIVPQLNVIGESGFPLPMIKHVQFVNVDLTAVAHALCVTADVKYVKK